MTWRASKHLKELSRVTASGQKTDEDSGRDGCGEMKLQPPRLPVDEASTAVRSEQVFEAMAKPVLGGGGELRLNPSRIAEALDACGLDGARCAAMFSVSKWAKRDGHVALNRDEFGSMVERFSRPVRLRNSLRRTVDEHKTVHSKPSTIDGDVRTNRAREKAAKLKMWDQILDELNAED